MANIQYTKTDNVCFNESLGNIIIDQIDIEENDLGGVTSYNILWFGSNLYSSSQISDDGRLVEFLKNGTYSFLIAATEGAYTLGPYAIEITSPQELVISDVRYTKYACDSNGTARVFINGGTPPYNVVIGGATASTSGNYVLVSGIIPGTHDAVVEDANNCLSTYQDKIVVLDAAMDISYTQIIAPTLYDSYGKIKAKITGYGPFNLWFTNLQTNEITYIDALYTEYIENVVNELEYDYNIENKLVPGTYSVLIKNNFGCSIQSTLSVPNILPISINCLVVNDNNEISVNKQISLPIFDTILIPYKHIQENSNLWQLVKNCQLKDNINLHIDTFNKQYKIVRNMLDKYCLDENKIQILRLGNSSDNWFYYFHIAPGINLVDNPKLINSKYAIFNPLLNETYKLTFGLTDDGYLDSENASLIRGSFLLDGIDHNQFVNNETYFNFTNKKNNAYLSFNDTVSDEYDYIMYNISKKVLRNMYTAGYVTSINFLEQFNKLITYVNISDTFSSSLPNETYQYILQIKNMLRFINNFNYINSCYLFNKDIVPKLGEITLSIDGQPSFVLSDTTTEINEYDINYYYFNEDSTKLSEMYQNNEPVKTPYIKNISTGYVIVRVKDKYNNIPKSITINNTPYKYDDHYISAKRAIQQINNTMVQFFSYGDILCYVGMDGLTQTLDPAIPQPKPKITPPPTEIPTTPTIQQTKDISNTASLAISLYKNINCILYGPKNYQYIFDKNVTLINMIPGVYRIVGNEKDLLENNLYPQEFTIYIEKNTTNTIDIDFVSYRDKIFLKEII